MFLNTISKNLFWDVDPDKLDEEKNRRLIIERVFTMGDISDIKALIAYYGIKTIKNEIVYAGDLDKKTLKWASDFLNIPKNNFRCFIKKHPL